jgi:7,8-dihydropterin-6-yl-methyl-4-(beta-D-ribofuranosyl)aminobenzene 5'-phosphate synthase
MSNGLNRRDISSINMTTGVTAAAGDSRLKTYASLKIQEVEKLTVVVITDNYYDSLSPDVHIARRYRTSPGASIHAEHGISFYIETTVKSRTYGLMFDFGLDPVGVIRNMELLNIDLSGISAFGLSHGHFDHWGSLVSILKYNKLKIRKSAALYTGEETFVKRFSIRPSDSVPTYIGQLKKEEIEELGIVKIVEIKNPTEVIPGAYLTGNIDRVIEYEKGSPNLLIKRGDKLEQDIFQGEQAVICNVKNKGLVVITGCAHAGIINTVKHAQKITREKVHAVVGGFHLINAAPEIIERTLADMKAIEPDYIVPAHCTGFEATSLFAKEMPEQFIINTAGTSYMFAA